MRIMYLDILLVALDCEQGKLCVRDLDLRVGIGSGVNRVTFDLGADINNELSRRKYLCQVAVDLVLQFRNLDSRGPYGYVVHIADPLDWFCGISAR